MNNRKDDIRKALIKARIDTLALFDLADEKYLHESPGFGFRPIIWHFAHIGVFEGYWILQKLNKEAAPDARYERIFDPIRTPREDSKDLPSKSEMESFLLRVRDRVMRVLDKMDFDASDPLVRGGYVFDLILQHEYQHQETIVSLLHLLSAEKKKAFSAATSDWSATHDIVGVAMTTRAAAGHSTPNEMIEIPAGEFLMGADGKQFSYDNEQPQHFVNVPSFRIARLPVTNSEYAVFIEERGYERREFWSDEGWTWRESNDLRHPLQWNFSDGWRSRSMFDGWTQKPDHSVSCLSWFEADAYARFAGKRLPTEAEWEKAASWNPSTGQKNRFAWGDDYPNGELSNFDNNVWDTSSVGSFPRGASAYGLLDMTGNVWEWTSDTFAGFPGFEPFPYPEYSQEWFDGDHKVLKGGSWATRATLLRTSFRNFCRPQFQIAFAGLRLAEDI